MPAKIKPPKLSTEKPIKESYVERKVCDFVRSMGGMAEKFTSPNRRSVPDRLITLPFVPMFLIEFKRPGGRATQNQLRDHQRRRELGVEVYIIDNVEDGMNLIRNKLYEMIGID